MKAVNKTISIVLGWNYSTSLGVVRSLGLAGLCVDLYYIAKKAGGSRITASSKYLRQTTEHIGRDDDSIIEELLRIYNSEEEQCVLIPTDDYTTSLIDRYHKRLSSHFLMPYIGDGEDGTITKLMNKSIQTDRAASFNLKTINYHKIYLPDKDGIQIPAGISFPCFVKPLVSLDGRKTEMGKCNNENELLRQLETMRQRWSDRTVIVQDYIDIQEEYSISGLCLNDVVILPALLKRLYVGKHERGVTVVGKLVPLEDNISFVDNLRDLLKSLHYTGLFCIDLVRSKDCIYFSEINFRSAGSLYGYVKAGANLPSIFVKSLTGLNWNEDEAKVRYGTTFFYDKVGWEDLILGLCTKKEFDHYLHTSDYTFMKDNDDPQPGILLYEQLNKKYRNGRVKRMFPILSRCFSKLKKIFR